MSCRYTNAGSVGMVIQKALFVSLAVILASQQPLGAQATASVYNGSTGDRQNRVSVDFNSTPLAEALHALARRVKVGISYDTDAMPQKTITYRGEDMPIFEALDAILLGTGLVATLSENRKVIVIKENLPLLTVQQETITGTVTDAESGETLPGVNILVKGTSTGTSTNADGAYELTVESLQDTLVFSFIGYQQQTVPINGRTQINIEMQSQVFTGEEMVVVGYGTQRKANLTGSVSSVDMAQVEKKNVSQASQLLAGEVSGITVTQSSGKPGADEASLKIRGLGTFSGAGTDPLVLIDGVPGDINSINPSNVESINVLKDAASAAIYGSRAANGVILIQSKEGRSGTLQVNYQSYIGKQEATELPQYVDSWVYAEMKNIARENMGQNPEYTEEEINNFRLGEDRDNYPNKHHLKDLFNSGNGLQTKHNLSFQGGTEDTRYLFSAGYLNQNGLIEQNNYNRYDLFLNVNSDLKDYLRLDAKLFGNQSLSNEPAGITTDGTRVSDINGIIRAANAYNATVPGRRSDGTFGVQMGHPVAAGHLASESFGEDRNVNVGSNISLELDLLESLQLSSRLGYRWGYSKNKLFGAEFQADSNWSFGPSQVQVGSSESRDLILNLLADYDQTFGVHNIHVLGGFSHERSDFESLGGFRDNFPSNQLYYLSAGSSVNDENYEDASTWTLLSYFGRVNYSFQNKYLLEVNLRYDGSSRFAEGNRFGLFPSFSAGWIISEENFFQIPWIDQLKIRGSYGILGNQQIGTYPYQNTLSLGSVYPTGETEAIYPGVQLTNLAFQDITWEETTIINGGIDLNLFEDKLSLVSEYYYKTTQDILYQLSVSNVLGMSVGSQNAGEVQNKGWEFELNYRDRIGDLSFSISPNFSINSNEVTNLAGVERDISQGLFVGESLQSIYGYRTDGLFMDQADINNYAEQNYFAKPGFPRYRDISGPDGVPDGKVSSEYDRTVIGNQFPKYSYGMGLTANYKGFDFFMQLQGQAELDRLIQGKELAFLNEGNIQKWHVENRWTQENPDRNSEYPRLETALHQDPWGTVLEYWTRDASFLRINNLQLGYTVPTSFLGANSLRQLRIFLNGENIYSFNNFYPGWDPEMETTGTQNPTYYPITRMWSVGINVNF